MAGRSCLCKPHTSNLDSFGSPLGQVGVRRSARASRCQVVEFNLEANGIFDSLWALEFSEQEVLSLIFNPNPH